MSSAPQRWNEISACLDVALTLLGEERLAWLEGLRSRDPALAAEVETFLAEHRDLVGERFLESRALPFPAQSIPEQTIGPYRLIEQIGQGGMSTVWAAERVDGRFEGRVAIKFLKFALHGTAGQARFAREGSILGRFAHPHIARLMDAGISVAGQPYLILEYIEGEPIDLYCVRRRLSVEVRLRLFLDVLGALAHAHAHLIVHRDLKPSNVLVRNDGEAKLLDFGIAKLLEDEYDAAATQLTREGGSALTPLYAAPEQLTGGSITTATDVYALGVLLYALLSGQHPAAGAHSAAELVRAITSTEPRRMSEVVEGDSADAAKLRRTLRGDLDTIVSKALKKDPQERYGTVTALAEDLQHYLRHEPIGARPDAITYRAAKFVRRNRLGVALTGLAFLSVVIGSTATLIQAHTARRQREIAVRERDHANRVTDFMTRMFKISDPSEARGNQVTVREILDKTSKEIETNLTSDRETQAQLMDVMGEVYFSLGLYRQAEPLLRHALDQQRALLGPNHVDTLRTMNSLGTTLWAEDRYDEAETLLKAALEGRRRLLGPEHPDTLKSMTAVANVFASEGHLAGAEQMYREVLAARRHVLGPENFETLTAMSNLSWTVTEQGRLEEGEQLQRQAFEIERRTQGPDNVDTLISANTLAWILSKEKRYPEAEKIQRETLQIQRRVLGSDHTYTQRSLNNLADILHEEHRYRESEDLYVEIKEIQRRKFGENSSAAIGTLFYMAELETLQGHRNQALRLLGQAVERGLPPRLALLMENDDNFKALRSDPRFAALVADAKARAAAASKSNNP